MGEKGKAQNEKPKGRAVYVLALALALICLVVVYFWVHPKVTVPSESAAVLVVAEDFLQGNQSLAGWVTATNSFFLTDTVFFLLGRVLGFSWQALMDFLPGLFYGGFIVLALGWLGVPLPRQTRPRRLHFAVLAAGLVWLACFTPAESYTLLNPGSHTNLYLFVLLLFMCLQRYRDGGKWPLLLLGGLFSFAGYFSDKLTLMLAYAPLALVLLVSVLQKRAGRREMAVAIATATGGILAWLASLLWQVAGGPALLDMPVRFMPPGQWPWRIVRFFQLFCKLAGYTQSGGFSPLTLTGWQNIFAVLWVATILATMLWCTVRLPRLRGKEQLFYFAALLNVASCVGSDVALSSRYIVPAWLFGAVLAVCCLSRFLQGLAPRSPKGRPAAIALAALLGLGSLLSAVQWGIEWGQKPPAGEGAREAVAVWQDRFGGAAGYGSFRAAHDVAYYSDFELAIYPVMTLGRGISGWPELIKQGWYAETGRHVLITQVQDRYVDIDLAYSLLGPPDDEVLVGGYRLSYYAAELSGFVDAYYPDEDIPDPQQAQTP